MKIVAKPLNQSFTELHHVQAQYRVKNENNPFK